MEVITKQKNFNTCPECGGFLISIPERGEIACCQCGLVINENGLDFTHSDKRAYNHQERMDREHNGAPVTALTSPFSLHTMLSLKKITDPDLKRAALWNSRIKWNERNMLIATIELKRIASNLNLPEYVKITAMKLYKKVYSMKMIKGRSINSMVVACLYYSCKKLKISRTFQEFLEESSCSEQNLKRCYFTLVKELQLKIPVTNPISLISKYVADLDLGPQIENSAISILNSVLKINN